MREIEASPHLYTTVRAAFIQQGSSLNRYCIQEGIDRVWATNALLGKRNGPKARALRSRLVIASGIGREIANVDSL